MPPATSAAVVAVMSIHRLSAGAGYRYLLRHTACGDVDRSPETPLTAYYTASGNPPGRWQGTGLAGLAGGAGLPAGTPVDEATMGALFGAGHDPVTGVPLGRAYPAFRTVEQRVAARVARLPRSLTLEQRATLSDQFTIEEAARAVRHPVAGFDLTFTVPKSVSVLWALADPAVQAAIVAAHHAAVADTLAFAETRALFTRVGAQSCAQVDTRGAVATAFDHPDTRTGDPNLHTHLVIANKVQGPDGQWRSVDSRALFTAAVALSETYDNLLADHLTTRLGVTWQWRDRGPRRSPAHELAAIPDELLAVFSTRSAVITASVAADIHALSAATGRPPSRREVLRLRQAATLASRPDKTIHAIADLMASWRHRAALVLARTGQSVRDLVQTAVPRPPRRAEMTEATGPRVASPIPATEAAAGALADADTASLAGDVLAGLIERRSTWTRWNVLAETARQTRAIRCPDAAALVALHDHVVTAVLLACVAVQPSEAFQVPEGYRRQDGASVFTRAGADRYTHPLVLAAEHRLLAAHQDMSATVVPRDVVAACVTANVATSTRERVALAPDQVDAVIEAATSGRRIDVLIGPAGSGKTTALLNLRHAWEAAHGNGSVLGLAPSATAARELAAALGIPTENTAKWLHETATSAVGDPWRMKADQLVIVDEASLASTATLDVLTAQATSAGAKLLLVGDHHQLGAVDAGGAFALLADHGHPRELTSLWRFRHRWEAHATRAVRAGNPDVLDLYAEHQRLHEGPSEAMLETAYQNWKTDQQDGHSSILLAADRATVDALNERARTDRLSPTATPGPQTSPETNAPTLREVTTCEGTTIGVGDRVMTRRNNRRIRVSTDAGVDSWPMRGSQVAGRGDFVRNGMLWTVRQVHSDGSLTVTPENASDAQPDSAGPRQVTLPAAYVRSHLDLGYAITVHRAQGVTVDTAHLLVAPTSTREALYVGISRGRRANHAYVTTDQPDLDHDGPPVKPASSDGRQILVQVLARRGNETSATAAILAEHDHACSIAALHPIAATLSAEATARRWTKMLPQCGLTSEQVSAVHNSRSKGSLFAALRAGERSGHRMPAVLKHLTNGLPDGESTSAGDVAAVLHHRVTNWLSAHESPAVSAPAAQALLHELLPETLTAEPSDPAAPALTELDHLIRQRLTELLHRSAMDPADSSRAGDTPPPTRAVLGSLQDWRTAAAAVAAHTDLTASEDGTHRVEAPADDVARRRRLQAQSAARQQSVSVHQR